MNKLLCCFLFSALTLTNLKAQTTDNHPWCPPGATWVYRIWPYPFIDYMVYSYVNDEEIQGYKCKNIEVKLIEYQQSPPDFIEFDTRLDRGVKGYIKLRESNDSIYIFHDNQFKFMYSFSAKPNDTFVVENYNEIYKCSNADAPYFEKDTILVQGNSVKNYDGIDFQVVETPMRSYWTFGSNLIKNIGFDMSFLPAASEQPCSLITGDAGLECYTDNLRGTIIFGNKLELTGIMDCHSIVTGLNEIEKNKENLILFPNPTNGVLSFNIDNQSDFNVFVYDLTGNVIYQKNNTTEKTIDLEFITEGSYLIKVESKEFVYLSRFFKI